MELRGFRIGIVLLVFLTTLGIALGGQKLAHQQRVIAPLYSTFEAIDGVEEVIVEDTRQGVILTLKLADVDDLSRLIASVLDQGSTMSVASQLKIKDQENDKLLTVYYEMHYALEQAVTLGDFQQMAKEIRDIAQEHNVAYRVQVDSDYVYLQLHDDDNFLYQVLSRDQAPRIRRQSS